MKRALILQLALFLCIGSHALAQDSGDVNPAVFGERIDVNIVNVEVFVTDSQGRHVFGLTKEDFEITEDGRPVEITNFFTVEREDRLSRILQGEAGTEERASEVRKPVPADQQLSLVVYIDNFNISPGNRKRVLKELREFLEERAFQGDKVMVVTHNRKLEVVQAFTRERESILRALDKVGKSVASGNIEENLRRGTIEEMLRAHRDDEPLSAEMAMKSYADSAREDVRRSARALQHTLRSLAGLPGRKAILHVSDGIQNTPGEEFYVLYKDLFGRDAELNFDRFGDSEVELFKTVSREANAQRVTMYTLDSRGSLGSGGFTPDFAGIVSVSNASMAALNTARDFNLEAPLVEMAERTGGAALINSNNVREALDQVGRDFEMFYSLGYASPGGGDGSYHDIKVKIKHKGLKVRNRSGYVDKPVADQVADRTLSSLLIDSRENPLNVRLAFGEPEKEGR
ncbi:MAG: VWA domain-containing protein, partial [bacterium]|nr:VWA domain-containing protein [bacterium]